MSRHAAALTIALAVIAMSSLTAYARSPGHGSPSGSPGTTLMVDAFISSVEVTPGLCLPGDTPTCEGPHRARFRVTAVECTVGGRFEGATVPPGSRCSFDLRGVMEAISPLEKPACGAIAFRTQGRNTFEFAGTERAVHLEGHTIGTAVSISGFLDDADPDQNPHGDHVIRSAGVTRAEAAPGTAPCTTAPLTRAIFTGGATFGPSR